MSMSLEDLPPRLWEKKFPTSTTRHTSNADESVVAIASIDGTVSLLRGSDGTLVATRRVILSDEALTRSMPATIRFVAGVEKYRKTLKDILIILVPSDSPNKDEVELLLVSGIDGKSLNSTDAPVVEKAKKMIAVSIVGLSIPEIGEGSVDGVNVNGCLLNDVVVRIFLADNVGRVFVFDYDYTSKILCHERCQIEFGLEKGKPVDDKEAIWRYANCCNMDFSFHVTTCLCTIVVCLKSSWKICWFDVKSLDMIGEHVITPSTIGSGPSRCILFCSPVAAVNEKAVAATIAVRTKEGISLQVIQAIISSMLRNNHSNHPSSIHERDGICNVHSVFHIPLEKEIACIDPIKYLSISRASVNVPFSFVLECIGDRASYRKLFVSDEKNRVGRFRFLLASGLYDEAETFLSQEEICLSPYGSIHSSEVEVWRFQSLLDSGQIMSKENIEVGKALLRKLAHGAVSGGSIGAQSLISAAEAIYDLPQHRKMVNISMKDYRLALTAMSTAIQNALNGVVQDSVESLERQWEKLDLKIHALKAAESIIADAVTQSNYHSWLAVVSPAELFNNLVSRGEIALAALVQTVDESKSITLEVLAHSLTQINSSVDPKGYLDWLEGILVELSGNCSLLSVVQKWACRTAEDFDENEFGIDSAIQLLQVVEGIVLCESLQINNTFLTVGFRGDASLFLPNPTVMRVNFIRGSNALLSKRLRHHSSDHSQTDSDEQDFSRQVETKLKQARVLKHARSIGPGNHLMRLKGFDAAGGYSYLSQQLLRHYSTTKQFENIMSYLKPFCTELGVDFDQIIASYARELCTSAANDTSAILGAITLVNVLQKPDTKSYIALHIFRAALLCDEAPQYLHEFYADMIKITMHEKLRSELKEAYRLLVINDIIRRYCGSAARDLFRISDSRHCYRLLEYICRFIDSPTVLSDALFLCDAFTHLSRSDACVLIFQRTMFSCNSNSVQMQTMCSVHIDRCGPLLRRLFDIDAKTAAAVSARACILCAEILEDGKMALGKLMEPTEKQLLTTRLEKTCENAIIVLSVAIELIPPSDLKKYSNQLVRIGATSFNSLLYRFERLHNLQLKFGIYLCLSDFGNQRELQNITKQVFSSIGALASRLPSSETIGSDHLAPIKSLILKAKRIVSLLFEERSTIMLYAWCRLIAHVSSDLIAKSMEALSLIRLLDLFGLHEIVSGSAPLALFYIGFLLCVKAGFPFHESEIDDNITDVSSIMRSFCAGSLIQGHAIVLCRFSVLPSLMHASFVTDMLSQVLVRTDGGLGEQLDVFSRSLKMNLFSKRFKEWCPNVFTVKTLTQSNIASRLVLQPSWYVGDGLLLHPVEAISGCIEYCNSSISLCGRKSNRQTAFPSSLQTLLVTRGAYALACRLHIFASSVALNQIDTSNPNKNFCWEQSKALVHLTRQLAERSLGTAGGGFISGAIDSQLAMAHIVTLPMEQAFKLYKSSLPSALNGKEYHRVLMLAGIGLKIGGETSEFADCQYNGFIGWPNQELFLSQCRALAMKARWWIILNRLEVDVEPGAFDRSTSFAHSANAKSKNDADRFVTTLLGPLIMVTSKALSGPSSIHSMLSDYLLSFGLDPTVATNKYIEYLLTFPISKSGLHKHEMIQSRDTTKEYTETVKVLLSLLPSQDIKSAVLRKCLLSLESIDESGQDYERYELILSLYKSSLTCMLSKYRTVGCEPIGLIDEIDLISRRIDALNILSSYFREDKAKQRPLFQRCFSPLATELCLETKAVQPRICSVLGDHQWPKGEAFDPLLSIQQYLEKDPYISSASALAPLCVPLSLPSGYIHARSLIQRIKRCHELGSDFVSFKETVEPVIRRLKSPSDATLLAEWCAHQYPDGCEDKLKCLELAENLAFISSSEAESRSRRGKLIEDTVAEIEENPDLDRFKKISSERAALSDWIAVQKIMVETPDTSKSSHLQNFLCTVCAKARSLSRDNCAQPDTFAENLLLVGSRMVVEAFLDESVLFTLDEFRIVAMAVHKACRFLETKYSHISVASLCFKWVREWLVRGEGELIQEQTLSTDYQNYVAKSSIILADSPSGNLVLDLNDATQVDAPWWKSKDLSIVTEKVTTAVEENSTLRASIMSRERSEKADITAGLRIAFVLSFCESFHYRLDGDEGQNKENREPQNIFVSPAVSIPNKIVKTESRESVLVLSHARFLLRLVFTKSTAALFQEAGSGSDTDTSDHELDRNVVNKSRMNALTFAMRYRALRAAHILCPEDVLNIVVQEENICSGNSAHASMALKHCYFSSFVAKEIEVMGLNLPNSDIFSLSTMHYPSYARVLLKSFGCLSSGFKGRLLCLLLELTLACDSMTDYSLVSTFLSQIASLELPRTHLLVCECIVRSKYLDLILRQDSHAKIHVSLILETLGKAILRELDDWDSVNVDIPSSLNTVRRYGYLSKRLGPKLGGCYEAMHRKMLAKVAHMHTDYSGKFT